MADLNWRKSTRCEAHSCVEVAWRVSSRCVAAAHCVSVATADAVLVRDTKDPTGPILSFTPTAWTHFVTGVGDITP